MKTLLRWVLMDVLWSSYNYTKSVVVASSLIFPIEPENYILVGVLTNEQ